MRYVLKTDFSKEEVKNIVHEKCETSLVIYSEEAEPLVSEVKENSFMIAKARGKIQKRYFRYFDASFEDEENETVFIGQFKHTFLHKMGYALWFLFFSIIDIFLILDTYSIKNTAVSSLDAMEKILIPTALLMLGFIFKMRARHLEIQDEEDILMFLKTELNVELKEN